MSSSWWFKNENGGDRSIWRWWFKVDREVEWVRAVIGLYIPFRFLTPEPSSNLDYIWAIHIIIRTSGKSGNTAPEGLGDRHDCPWLDSRRYIGTRGSGRASNPIRCHLRQFIITDSQVHHMSVILVIRSGQKPVQALSS